MTVLAPEATYYATPTYRVSLRHLQPGETLSASVMEGHGLWMPISTGLKTIDNKPIKQGQCIRWQCQQGKVSCSEIQNGSQASIDLLELAWAVIPPNEQKPLESVTETRPWGSFTVLADEPHYKLKQLFVTSGNRLSLQRHQKREEHWFITAGQPVITLNQDTLTPTLGEYVHIPLHAWHRLANPEVGGEGVEIIELQLGSYFGEDDIERQSDDYGRQ